MIDKFFSKEKTVVNERRATVIKTNFPLSLRDTLECGQCFRHELICESDDGYAEYLIPVGTTLINVAQRALGELIFFEGDDPDFDKTFEEVIRPYFTLDTDYKGICADIIERTDSQWLKRAARVGEGIAILKQDEWEAIFSFIVSQNNNIPRIRKIIRQLSAAYGVNISLQNGASLCPANRIDTPPCEEKCRECGVCYTFPNAADVAREPEKMLPSRPGFRFKYLLDAAERVTSGELDLKEIFDTHTYRYTVERLKTVKGVGDKVASCAALFGFANLEAFPIDVWMRRAIDEYFGGNLDPETLGDYAGLAQQYIFHYIRNIEK